MRLCNTLLVLTIGMPIFAVLLAYLSAPTFPDTASNHGLKIAFSMVVRLITCVSDVGSTLGFSKVNIMRSMTKIFAGLRTKPTDIHEYTTTIENVEVLVMKPAGTNDGELRPGIVHYHGGGWVILTPEEYSQVIEELVRQTQAVVVSVNYRRAPEHPFPAAIEDCLKVTRYVLIHAEEYGVDKNRIGVKGDSAGGNLAMAVSLDLTKDEDPDIPKLRFMSLDFPALQAFDLALPSYVQYEKGPGFLNKKVMLNFWLLYAFGHLDFYTLFDENAHISKSTRNSKYSNRVSIEYLPKEFKGAIKDNKSLKETPKELTDEIEKIILNPMFSPLLVPDEDLAKLPPTNIINAEFDVLRDDSFIVAKRLRSVGVEVEHSFFPEEEHGFLYLVEMDPNLRKEYTNFAKFFNRTVG